MAGRGIRMYTTVYGEYYGEVASNTTPQGHGTYYYNNGTEYRGGWVAGLYEGKGKLMSPAWGYLDGYWKGGKCHGHVLECLYATSTTGESRFEGEYVDNVREGRGKGIVEDLVRDGQVVCHGTTCAGVWSGGKQIGRGVWASKDGSKYVGEFKGGAFDGEGMLYGTIPDRFSSKFLSRPIKLHG